MAFLSQIRDWNHGETPPRLVMDLPKNLMTMEHRKHFRVPLRGDHGLDVRVQTANGRVWPVTPVDISLGGMLVEFIEEPDLAIDAPLDVELRWQANTAKIRGIVRHRRQERYGVFFPDSGDPDGIGDASVLRRIVGTLEQQWLKSGQHETSPSND
jgi:hypothetical protein